MDSIKIEVVGNIARVTEKPKRITSGTIGLPVKFNCDYQWTGLRKTAVFRAGNELRKVENIDDTTIVPWEVLREAGPMLSIGLYGLSKGDVEAIPTVWVNISAIREGANPDECDPAKMFPDTEDATMEAGDLLEGEIGYAKGEKIVGTLRKVQGVFNEGGEHRAPEGSLYESVFIDILPTDADRFIIADEYGNEAIAILVSEETT